MYSGARKEMISVETQYFSLNRILLLSIGLWPYQKSILVRFQIILIFSILTSFIMVQLTTFLTSRCTSDLIIKIFSTTFFFFMVVTNYIAFGINTEIVKDLLAQLQHIYNHLRDENEYAIIEKYGYIAKRCTVILGMLGTFSIFIFVVIQYRTSVLDIILPINGSRPHRIQITTEYFIDQQKYFFLIVLHVTAAYCVGAITIIAVGAMVIAYLLHICGMFRIASYRIEHTLRINILENNNDKKTNLMHDEIFCAIDIHRQAVRLCKLLMLRFEAMLFFLIIFGVICLSLNLFRISQMILSKNNVEEILFLYLIAIILVIYMFVANYIGQIVTDHNNQVFNTAYNVEWYIVSLNMQRIILFLLQRGTKEFTLNVSGLFVASMECFAMLVKTSVSYFTVMNSVQQ